jgi:hypothetical protein
MSRLTKVSNVERFKGGCCSRWPNQKLAAGVSQPFGVLDDCGRRAQLTRYASLEQSTAASVLQYLPPDHLELSIDLYVEDKRWDKCLQCID